MVCLPLPRAIAAPHFTSLAAGLDPGRRPVPAALYCLFLRGTHQVLARPTHDAAPISLAHAPQARFTRSQVLVRPIYSVLFDCNTNAKCSQYRPWAPLAAESDQGRPSPGYSCMLGPAARVVFESHGSWRGRMRSRPQWQVHTSPHILKYCATCHLAAATARLATGLGTQLCTVHSWSADQKWSSTNST